MKILLATGIYPPALGGPSQYAKNIHDEWLKVGHDIRVKYYDYEHSLPTGIRHLYYLLRIIPDVFWCDCVVALDTYSVGLPAAIAASLFGKKIVIRTGGDFLWESYVERSGDKVLLKDFYKTTRSKWSFKERLIFTLTKWTLHHVDTLIFSTDWQRDIWYGPYSLNKVNLARVENFYGPKEESFTAEKKVFLAGTRKLVWKNLDILKEVFAILEIEGRGVTLDLNNYNFEEFMFKMANSYAVILTSLGDISPNMILDAIRHNKPFIVTRENGLLDRIGDIAITIDPFDAQDIKEKVLWLSDETNYRLQEDKIRNFNFVHSWQDIANEIIEICKKA